MKRRNFLKKLPVAISIPFTIGNIPINVMADNALTDMAASSMNDKVLVILQLHGGNDGLNSLIPIHNYELYYNARPNIAIPIRNATRKVITLDSTLPSEQQVGLHPDMAHMKSLYDRGRMSVLQGVSYKNNNGSHFRGRDISFMGGGADDYFTSGWIGRYLNKEYAPLAYPGDFPNNDMKDPLAIETGNDLSLIFHQEGNIPTSISLNNPKGFAQLVDELQGFQEMQNVDPRGIPPASLIGSPYYKEMQWILGLEDKSEDYAQRLYEVFQAGGNTSVSYPERYPFNAPKGSMTNGLSAQLKLVAQLLAGGCKTKVFLVRMGGFDTHAEQVESYDPTMGIHAALMYHLSSAMDAFQTDLRVRGLEDRVLTVTTSEFGRRIYSNGSYGTDHGSGGPIFMFGRNVKPGVLGKVPDLNQGNVDMQFDYRQIYASILKDWMEVDPTVLKNDIFFGDFINGPIEGVPAENIKDLQLTSNLVTGTKDFVSSRFALNEVFPNPARDKVVFSFTSNSEDKVSIKVFDQEGRSVLTVTDQFFTPGHHRIEQNISALTSGLYIYKMSCGAFSESKKLIIQ